MNDQTSPARDVDLAAPLIEPLGDFTPLQVFRCFSKLPHCLFLDSALRRDELGRYSFLAADPFEVYAVAVDDAACWDAVAKRLQQWRAVSHPEAPPFQGGAAGLFGYELNRTLESLPTPKHDEFRTPAMSLGFYDVVVAFDHQRETSVIVSQGFPETEPTARQRRARERLQQARSWLSGDMETVPLATSKETSRADTLLSLEDLAPQFRVSGPAGLLSSIAPDDYCSAVQQAVDYIHAGDAFQVNLAQRLLFPALDDSRDLYLRLRERNPATFAAYYDLGEFQVVSASPERFVRVQDGLVETRPIKGTRPRSTTPEADLYAAEDLRQSEKDRAENIMIVDLLRNDLSRVCEPDSVAVTQLCDLETYQYVQHLVSAVCGRLRADCTPLDLVRCSFPGGSITGAPKIRAMEIISELEPTARGPYCGSLGYLGFDGSTDLNILIRTITAGRGWWQFPVGGGVVAQSLPEREYEETWQKAEGLIRALR